MVIGYKRQAARRLLTSTAAAPGNGPIQPAVIRESVARTIERGFASSLGFEGEFARLFGSKRRGASSSFGRFHAEDDEDFHKHHLDVEEKYLPAGLRQRRNAGTEKGCGPTSPLSVPPLARSASARRSFFRVFTGSSRNLGGPCFPRATIPNTHTGRRTLVVRSL